MIFKDQVAQDMAVFCNPEEFADQVMFQGRSVVAVLSRDSEQALQEWRKRTHEPPGVGVELLTVSLAAGDVERLYAGDEVDLDGVRWNVLSSSIELGLRTIHLYRHES